MVNDELTWAPPLGHSLTLKGGKSQEVKSYIFKLT
jgi:hypothetical protein